MSIIYIIIHQPMQLRPGWNWKLSCLYALWSNSSQSHIKQSHFGREGGIYPKSLMHQGLVIISTTVWVKGNTMLWWILCTGGPACPQNSHFSAIFFTNPQKNSQINKISKINMWICEKKYFGSAPVPDSHVERGALTWAWKERWVEKTVGCASYLNWKIMSLV